MPQPDVIAVMVANHSTKVKTCAVVDGMVMGQNIYQTPTPPRMTYDTTALLHVCAHAE